MKRIFLYGAKKIAIWSEIFMRSETKPAIWSVYFRSETFFYDINQIFIVMWSEIRYLKLIFRYDFFERYKKNMQYQAKSAIYCHMKRFSIRLESNSSIWRIFSIWNEFILWYEATFSRDFKRNPLYEANFFIWNITIFSIWIIICMRSEAIFVYAIFNEIGIPNNIEDLPLKKQVGLNPLTSSLMPLVMSNVCE